MNLLLIVLSVAGFLAALRRLLFALLRLAKGGVDAFVAREVGRSRAERGDVSGLLEAREWRRNTRSTRVRAVFESLVWAAILVLPLLTRITVPLYAAYSLLWLPAILRRKAA